MRTKVQDRDSRGYGSGVSPDSEGAIHDPSTGTVPPSGPVKTEDSFRSTQPGGSRADYFPFWDKVPPKDQHTRPRTFSSEHRFGGEPLLRNAALRIRSDDDLEARSGVYPWVTFVLGSGCLADERAPSDARAGDADRSDVATLVEPALEPLRKDGDLGGRLAELRELTIDFLLETADEKTSGHVKAWVSQIERLHAGINDPSLGADARRVAEKAQASHQLGVIAALAAALAAKLYLSTTMVTRTSLSPSQREFVTFDLHRYPQLGRIHAQVRKPLEAVWRYLGSINPNDAPAVSRTFLQIVERIASDKVEVISREQVEVLRSFAWHFLTSGTDVYPGWADILLFQTAGTETQSGNLLDVPMLRRPGLKNLAELADLAKPSESGSGWLSGRLDEVTRRSWRERAQGGGSEREAFYSAVAESLLAQARHNKQNIDAPLATAFISGFDLELDMALLHRGRDNGDSPARIAVVVPVFRVRRAGPKHNTTLHWVWKFVEGGDESSLEALLKRGEWTPVGDKIRQELAGVPVLVHLSGAPLITVALENVRSLPTENGDTLGPALLLDENTSLIQVALDLRRVNGQLPVLLSSDPPPLAKDVPPEGLEFGPRYWIFVGVQLADPSVRLRLLSREISSQWGNSEDVSRTGEDSERSATRSATKKSDREISVDVRGVVVNAWSPPDERQLFHWQGFGVVRGRAYELVDDIKILAAWAPPKGGDLDE